MYIILLCNAHLCSVEVAIRAVWLGTNRTEPPFSPYFNVPGSNRHYPWLLTSRLRFPDLRFANRHEPARQTEQTRVEPRTAQACVEPRTAQPAVPPTRITRVINLEIQPNMHEMHAYSNIILI